jgi:hypothetical protein
MILNKGLPHWFMPSPLYRPFRLEQRVDLAPAAAPPKFGGGRVIVFSYKVPKNQTIVVQSLVFCLWQRINIGGTDENYQLLTNADVAGKILFTVLVDNQAQPFVENQHNPAAPLSSATNSPKLRSAGFTSVSENPDVDLLGNWFNPLFSFAVRSEQTLQVLFEVLSVNTGMAKLQMTNDPLVTNRVDFAGVYVAGQIMSDSDFTRLAKEQ